MSRKPQSLYHANYHPFSKAYLGLSALYFFIYRQAHLIFKSIIFTHRRDAKSDIPRKTCQYQERPYRWSRLGDRLPPHGPKPTTTLLKRSQPVSPGFKNRKKIVVRCDGTWKNEDSPHAPLTNVARISRCRGGSASSSLLSSWNWVWNVRSWQHS